MASDPEPNPSPEAATITLTRPATLTTVIEVSLGVSMATSQSAGWVLGRKYRNLRLLRTERTPVFPIEW